MPMSDDTTLEHCPTCGALGCVGYCSADPADDSIPESERPF